MSFAIPWYSWQTKVNFVMKFMEINPITALNDNYIWSIEHQDQCVIVDPVKHPV